MGLVDRMRAIVEPMPDDASVTLSVEWLRGQLAEEGEQGVGRLLTLEEAGEIVGRSPSTIRTWANGGQLNGAFKLQGRSWRIPEATVQRFIERQQSGEHELPMVARSGPVDLGDWRKHVKPGERGVA